MENKEGLTNDHIDNQKMLRNKITSSFAQCSRSVRPSSRIIGIDVRYSGKISAHNRYCHHLPIAPLCQSRSFRLQAQDTRNALKAQKRYYSSESEDSDAVIELLNLVVRKRDLLIEQERQGKGDISTSKAIGELDQAQKLQNQWKEIQKTVTNLISMTDPAIEPDEDFFWGRRVWAIKSSLKITAKTIQGSSPLSSS